MKRAFYLGLTILAVALFAARVLVAQSQPTMQGPNAGKSAVSDSTGSFAIFGVTPGPAKVQVSKGGFQSWTSKDFDLQGDTKLAVELFPAPPTNASGAATGRCNDGSWTWSTSHSDA